MTSKRLVSDLRILGVALILFPAEPHADLRAAAAVLAGIARHTQHAAPPKNSIALGAKTAPSAGPKAAT